MSIGADSDPSNTTQLCTEELKQNAEKFKMINGAQIESLRCCVLNSH